MATYASAQDLISYASDVTFDPTGIEGLLRRAEDDIDRILPVTTPVLVLYLSGDPDGGSFTISFDGDATAAIPFDAVRSQVEDAIEALASVGVGGVAVTGGPVPKSTMQINFSQALITDNVVVGLSVDGSLLTGGSDPTANLTWRKLDPATLILSDRVALNRAVCAQAEYRNEMGPKFFRRPQYDSVSGPDFNTKGKLPYYAPMVKRELAKTSLQVTGARASAGVGSRKIGTDWVAPIGPGWPAPVERWWET